ncbi:hypothetical protein BH23GEM6_BH23GEM6_23870 [soil metagenome]
MSLFNVQRYGSMAAALLLPLLAACSSATSTRYSTAPEISEPTTVFVVRHAERISDQDRVSPLSGAGHDRAHALAEALGESGIQAIYVTQYQRTRQTAEPIAARLGLMPQVQATSVTPPELARAVLDRHRGGTVLIVGHSNTVNAIVNGLGGPALPELESSRYGDLFVVIVPAEGPVRTTRAQFGMPAVNSQGRQTPDF